MKFLLIFALCVCRVFSRTLAGIMGVRRELPWRWRPAPLGFFNVSLSQTVPGDPLALPIREDWQFKIWGTLIRSLNWTRVAVFKTPYRPSSGEKLVLIAQGADSGAVYRLIKPNAWGYFLALIGRMPCSFQLAAIPSQFVDKKEWIAQEGEYSLLAVSGLERPDTVNILRVVFSIRDYRLSSPLY
jgi:hypothetical protein